METMQIVYVALEKIKPYKNNPRNNNKAVEKVMKSIQAYGFKVPCVLDKNYLLITGHTRWEAAKRLKMKKIPCIIASDLSKAKADAFRIADNKVAEYSKWDMNKLKDEISKLQLEDVSFDDLGFDVSEYDYLDDIDADAYSNDGENNDAADSVDVAEDVIVQAGDKNDEYFYFEPDEIKQDVVDGWKTYETVQDYVESIIDIPTAKYQFNRLCQGYRSGYNISLLFNPHRLTTETKKNKSIFYAINNDKNYRKQFARYMVDVSAGVVPACDYYKYIGIGCDGFQHVNEFQPYLARDIYKKYCKNGDRVLDPCAGWGGRMLGAVSSLLDLRYVATDPSTLTYDGLLQLREFLEVDEKRVKLYNKPFEELKLKPESFDFVFTSPPYFDTEHYADEESQSMNKFDSYKAWRKGFLFVMLDKIYACLKPGKKCLLNVGAVQYDIAGDIIAYMRKKYNVEVERVKDFKIGGNGIGNRTGEGGEPFLLFEKI